MKRLARLLRHLADYLDPEWNAMWRKPFHSPELL